MSPFGDLTAQAETRKDVLARLLPRLFPNRASPWSCQKGSLPMLQTPTKRSTSRMISLKARAGMSTRGSCSPAKFMNRTWSAIANQCTIDGKFLIVRGDLRTYKIHLGSGNILMEPNDQYLCIVPDRSGTKGKAEKVFLPFEGDQMSSIILSKAFLLAKDTQIKDESIIRQIRIN